MMRAGKGDNRGEKEGKKGATIDGRVRERRIAIK